MTQMISPVALMKDERASRPSWACWFFEDVDRRKYAARNERRLRKFAQSIANRDSF